LFESPSAPNATLALSPQRGDKTLDNQAVLEYIVRTLLVMLFFGNVGLGGAFVDFRGLRTPLTLAPHMMCTLPDVKVDIHTT
jgi:hypothetical protein